VKTFHTTRILLGRLHESIVVLVTKACNQEVALLKVEKVWTGQKVNSKQEVNMHTGITKTLLGSAHPATACGLLRCTGGALGYINKRITVVY